MRKSVYAAGAMGGILLVAGLAVAQPQSPMYATLSSLQQTRHIIFVADQAKDYGGHFARATALIDTAIKEVELGIEFRIEHGG
jgi:hypothetical protein